MAGSLEVAKLVIASLLYQYWDTINKALRTYLTIASIILVLITSMGIYGFLSAAYQDTYQQLTVTQNKVSFLEEKAKFYEDDVARYDQELERISNNISTLSNAKATSIQVRDTTSSTGLRSTVSTAELRLSQQRIEVEEENRKEVNARRTIAADSLQKYRLDILELQNNSAVAGELGPLQYLSGLTGTPMDKIINWLLLVIIFVFDPLAISLVVAANFAFANAFPKREEEIPAVFEDKEFEKWEDETDYLTSSPANKERLDKAIEELEVKDPIVVDNKEDFLAKLDEIEARMVKDTLIEEQDKKIQQQSEKIEQLENEIDYAHEEINELDRAAIQIVDGLKHIDDYLKHHGAYYDKNGIKWDQVKLGFAEKSDYIEKRKQRSKPKGKDKDNIITY